MVFNVFKHEFENQISSLGSVRSNTRSVWCKKSLYMNANANIAIHLCEPTEIHCFPYNEGPSSLSFHVYLSLFHRYRYYSSSAKKINGLV